MIPPPPSPDLISFGFSPTVVPPDGTGSSGIMISGEAPGKHESEDGIPFHPKADAGSVLAKVLRRCNVSRDSLTLTNICYQRPPMNELDGEPYELEAVRYYRPFNEALIKERAPKVIILAGNVPMRAFTEFGREEGRMITNLANYAIPATIAGHETILLFSLHPSFILHGQQAFTQTLIWSVQRAFQLARDGLRPQPTQYVPFPTESDMLAFERDFDPAARFLSFDIETPESAKLSEEEVEDKDEDISYNIIRASLCYDAERGYAISFPWQAPFVEIAQRMLARAQRLEVWNRYFDVPRLKAAGTIFNGRIYDRMQSWRFLQPTLPASLEFVTPLLGWNLAPWKFLSQKEPAFYSAVDAHALRFNGVQIEAALAARGATDLHERHVVQCFEVLEKMSGNGLPLDQVALTQFKERLEGMKKERETSLQTRVPDALKPVKQKTGYKKLPKVVEGLVKRTFRVKWGDLTKAEQAGIDVTQLMLPGSTLTQDEVIVEVERWAKLEEFNPNSPPQMQRLVKHLGFKPGTNRKTKKPTMDDETIRKIIRKCLDSKRSRDQEALVTIRLAREVKQIAKVLGTYVKGWRAGSDGRVHASPGFWGKMFRISWRRPNTSAVIADKSEEYIAAGFRKCVAPTPPRLLVEADWKGIEAVIVGWLAKDAQYMRLARIGVHDYFACHLLADRGKILQSDIPSLSLPDSELKAAIKFVKKKFPKDRDDAKHTVHGPLTPEHEILTTVGWMRIDQYDTVTPVAQWRENGEVLFAPAGLFSKDFVGDLVILEGVSVSTAMTPDHGVPVKTSNPSSHAKVKRVAAEALPKEGRLPLVGEFQGPAEVIGTKEEEEAQANLIKLVAATQADGSVYRGNEIRFHLIKERKKARLREIAKGRKLVETPGEKIGAVHFRLSGEDTKDILACLSSGKTFKLSWLLGLPLKSRLLFLDELPLWDGSYAGKMSGRQTIYFTCNRKNADIVQAVAHISGRQALLRNSPPPGVGSYRILPMYAVSFNRRKEARLSCMEKSRKPYVGKVYCIANTLTGWVFIRHNGRVSIQSNSNYGMTAPLLSSLYELPMEQAEKLLDLYFAIFPLIRKFQEFVKAYAAEKVWLQNAFGYRMPFWEIYRWDSQCYERLLKVWKKPNSFNADGTRMKLSDIDREWVARIAAKVAEREYKDVTDAISEFCWSLGDDAKSAISFLPRDTAAAMLKEVLLRLRWLAEDRTLLLSTHDSLLCEIAGEHKLAWIAELLRDEMEKPVPELDGLSIGVEVKYGHTWDSADDEDEGSMRVYEFPTARVEAGKETEGVVLA